jgi:tetraprenyl-beta-curcumene synthase
MARANARFWPTVLPQVHRGLRHWEDAARQIPDETLRGLALAKIADESFNTEVAATLATLTPRRRRARVIEAIVALQVMYDYLDGLSEESVEDPLDSSRRLFGAFKAALTPGDLRLTDSQPAFDSGDGGYLESLVATCRRAFAGLPAASLLAPVAREAATRCGESQSRTHAVGSLGIDQLVGWAEAEAEGTGLTWWEYTAGGTASILSVHALIAAADAEHATLPEARRLDRAYLYIAAISTLLDSVVDYRTDLETGSHSFIAYYGDEERMAAGIGKVISRAMAEAREIENSGHHQMTAAGVAAYYLSDPATASPPGPAVKARAVEELGPIAIPVLGIFRLWRLGKSVTGLRGRRA